MDSSLLPKLAGHFTRRAPRSTKPGSRGAAASAEQTAAPSPGTRRHPAGLGRSVHWSRYLLTALVELGGAALPSGGSGKPSAGLGRGLSRSRCPALARLPGTWGRCSHTPHGGRGQGGHPQSARLELRQGGVIVNHPMSYATFLYPCVMF